MSIEYASFMNFLGEHLGKMREALAARQEDLAKTPLDKLAHELSWSNEYLRESARYAIFQDIHDQLMRAPADMTRKVQPRKPGPSGRG